MSVAEAVGTAAEPPKVGASYMRLVVLAALGVQMALVTPIAISLAIRLEQIAPGREEYLGYITGAGSAAAVLSGPVFGVLSDRARTRWGRRRPFLVWGAAGGTAALLVLAAAPGVLLLGCGWVLMYLTWGVAGTLLVASQADRVPVSQRGRISGFGGFVAMLAPILGAVVAGNLSGDPYLLFLVPGALGMAGLLLFVWRVGEPDARDLPAPGPLTVRELAGKYLFDVRRHPDFAWNLLGRFLFVCGLTLSTAFTAYFLAWRLEVPVDEAAGPVAVLGGVGVLAAMAGALGSGYASDLLGRRLPLAAASAVLFAAGATVMAAAPDLPAIVAGSALCNLGIGAFSAIDQAIALDLVPDRETDAGRYMAIYTLSNSAAHAVAPFAATVVLTAGASAGEKNYPLLYLAAGVFTVAGGAVLFRIKSIR
ncbi:MFS transporter [Actinocorallia libanotica]|uniref:MFS transporter n=1 Tax=Actinocorallia libanotica TaxID=46162 RepID=A0ABP4C2N2_9ACTN